MLPGDAYADSGFDRAGDFQAECQKKDRISIRITPKCPILLRTTFSIAIFGLGSTCNFFALKPKRITVQCSADVRGFPSGQRKSHSTMMPPVSTKSR